MSELRHPERRVSLSELEAAIAVHGSFDAAVAALDADADGVSDDPPPTPALDAWYEDPRHRNVDGQMGRDSVNVRLWFPREAPYAVLQTLNARGFHDPKDYLPDPERPLVNVHLGSSFDIGGHLSEMEAYFAAVLDSLRVARWQADAIAYRMAVEAEGSEAHS